MQLNRRAMLIFLIDSPKRTSCHFSVVWLCAGCQILVGGMRCLIFISLQITDFSRFNVSACALPWSNTCFFIDHRLGFKLCNNIHNLSKWKNCDQTLHWSLYYWLEGRSLLVSWYFTWEEWGDVQCPYSDIVIQVPVCFQSSCKCVKVSY